MCLKKQATTTMTDQLIRVVLNHHINNSSRDLKVHLEETQQPLLLSGGDQVNVKVSASMIQTHERAIKLSGCFEGHVDRDQCRNQCRANFQLQLCGCLPWSYSRFYSVDAAATTDGSEQQGFFLII